MCGALRFSVEPQGEGKINMGEGQGEREGAYTIIYIYIYIKKDHSQYETRQNMRQKKIIIMNNLTTAWHFHVLWEH